MTNITRTTSNDPDFLKLVTLLDADLAVRNGDKHAFYSQFNKLDKIKHVVVAYEDGEPAGCGAIKEYAHDTMEVKRMFVVPAHRRKGIAEKILIELESWTADLSYSQCILETSLKQQEAIGLYRKRGYKSIPNFGQYVGEENSICFVKQIIP
jgi:GNAT superfamily N-acetyltransferase